MLITSVERLYIVDNDKELKGWLKRNEYFFIFKKITGLNNQNVIYRDTGCLFKEIKYNGSVNHIGDG